ncbi:acetyl-CoA hydrolase/transferase C-terminal domain-containing protein [Dokdonella sp.]|uniref:acetyl-CoA hydrolase/transferase C-terminal domain-containing protein n=1 Tax=Dokdonella sp. TaxID=2291710 RepID=UPI00261D15E4|nr:acetyl-CoA hydrolase/transferase C-terminal domain-containing protein [Dokdonella sp.]
MRTLPPYLSLDRAVDALLAPGSRLSLAAPLGLGKPNRLLNALYARVKAEPARHLTLYTALSLDLPEAGSDLERRFLEPFLARHFGADYPRLDYVADLKAGRLPPNVRVQEFYFQSGAMLKCARAQRDYASINYTHVARDLAEDGLDAIVQLVARRGEGAEARYSLSCNPDVTLDVLDALSAAGKPRPHVIGVVHPDLPFLGGDADVGPEFFDALVEETSAGQPLFALPLGSVDLTEYAIGLHASALVRDGGTLQIGIGALSDAIVHALLLRHRRNADYREAVGALRGDAADADARAAGIGGLEPFTRGLYGASEMVMDGFMHLRRAGILTRRVVDDLDRQRAIDAGEAIDPAMLHGGHYLKGAFYLGTKALYDWLRGLEGEDWEGLAMCRVSDVNQLYGGREPLDAAQRRDARFFNTCMMATLLGAATSDALEDGRVVSGVGGQYNFVAMAHELRGGRSALLLRATRRNGRRVESNLRWSYGHTTIPRHLRDLYVTEYGVADLRGKSDEACVRAMLAISDARFVDTLAADAIRAGKLPRDFRVPEAWRANTPEGLHGTLQPFATKGLLPTFPFGSDFDAVERRLLPALLWLKSASARPQRWTSLLGALLAPGQAPEADACLARLGFRDGAGGWRQALLARLVRGALARTMAAD